LERFVGRPERGPWGQFSSAASSAAAMSWRTVMATVLARASHLQCPLTKISLCDAPSYRLPNQDNRLALVFDPFRASVPFTFGVEIFPPAHETPPHVHTTAHELFFILAGEGVAFCNAVRCAGGNGYVSAGRVLIVARRYVLSRADAAARCLRSSSRLVS
jgi:mannose-6-phosphate isomerase-like protein (cupin superfamily)